MVALLAVALPPTASGSGWGRFSQPAETGNALRPAVVDAADAAESHIDEPGAVGIEPVSDESEAADEDSEEKDADKDDDACSDEAKECKEAISRLRNDKLAAIDLDIRVSGRAGNDYPCECRLEGETFQPRSFSKTLFTWKAAGYCHKPLYFEQWNLERYGHSHGFIPDFFLSGAHFFVTLPILPYKMGVELPWECVYPLGYYRPGNCAPWTCPAVPISGRGLALEAATITGVVFMLP